MPIIKILSAKETPDTFKYQIGEIVQCGKDKDLFRIDDYIHLNNTKFGYTAHCLRCNARIFRTKFYFEKCSCNVCHGYDTKWNVNSVAMTHPEFISSFAHIEDAYKYPSYSKQKAEFKCPRCGKYLGAKTITNVVHARLHCPYCSDGISQPEKIMSAFLMLTNTNFVHQKSFDWSNDKKYDFFLPDYNILIETDGEHHYPEGSAFDTKHGKDYEAEHQNDIEKTELAIANGMTLVRINCSKTNFDFVSQNILNDSILQRYIDTSSLNYDTWKNESNKSYVYEAGMLWNQGYTSSQIGEALHRCSSSIGNWLHRCQSLGLLNKPYGKMN